MSRVLVLHVVAVALLGLLPCNQAVPSYFLPFGAGAGDTEVSTNDDASSGAIPLSQTFTMCDVSSDLIWVNTNGILSFTEEVWEFTPEAFPFDVDMIAPYWADADTTENHGRVFWREATAADLASIGADVNAALSAEISSFNPTWGFVATWNEVTFFGGDTTTPVNTFQAVLAMDDGATGKRAVTFFNYGSLTWTAGDASEGDDLGLNGIDAVAGYTVDGMLGHHMMPGSLSPSILDIQYTSNVGMPGRWFFKLCCECDPVQVECNTCGWTVGTEHDDITAVEQACNDQGKTLCAEGEVCKTRLKCAGEFIPKPGQSATFHDAKIIYKMKKECASPDKCDAESWNDGFLYKNPAKNLVTSKCCKDLDCCNENHGEELDYEFGHTSPNNPEVHIGQPGQGFPNGLYFCTF